MSFESLAVKYRPKTFEEVVGEEITINILKGQLDQGDIKHAYLFAGPSGCGKTSTARLVAHKINEYIDSNGNICSSEPIEIDAASNSGVENVRAIIENAKTRSIDGKYKVFIIDEVHALSTAAWQAFLKCIEEPPAYTIFIFCTTEFKKVPDTIVNRSMVFKFDRVKEPQIQEKLSSICINEGFINYESTVKTISYNCDGSVRTAISLLEKCASYSKDLSQINVYKLLGIFPTQCYFDLVTAATTADFDSIIQIIDALYQGGYNLNTLINSCITFIIHYLKYNLLNDIQSTMFTEDDMDNLQTMIDSYRLKKLLNGLTKARQSLKTEQVNLEVLQAIFISISSDIAGVA